MEENGKMKEKTKEKVKKNKGTAFYFEFPGMTQYHNANEQLVFGVSGFGRLGDYGLGDWV